MQTVALETALGKRMVAYIEGVAMILLLFYLMLLTSDRCSRHCKATTTVVPAIKTTCRERPHGLLRPPF